jgi:hypothetical protein
MDSILATNAIHSAPLVDNFKFFVLHWFLILITKAQVNF